MKRHSNRVGTNNARRIDGNIYDDQHYQEIRADQSNYPQINREQNSSLPDHQAIEMPTTGLMQSSQYHIGPHAINSNLPTKQMASSNQNQKVLSQRSAQLNKNQPEIRSKEASLNTDHGQLFAAGGGVKESLFDKAKASYLKQVDDGNSKQQMYSYAENDPTTSQAQAQQVQQDGIVIGASNKNQNILYPAPSAPGHHKANSMQISSKYEGR